MNVRPFEWRDLPLLHRYRSQCLFLDSTLTLTSGQVYAPAGALLSSIAPAVGIYTSYAASDGVETEKARGFRLFGQATHTLGNASARLSFLTPQDELGSIGLVPLVEHLAVQVGRHGGLHILAEVDELSPGFEALRRAGFGIYARQCIWRLPDGPAGKSLEGARRALLPRDLASVRFLYYNLVPGLVQQVEPPPTNRLQGLVYYRGTELLAYIDLKYGPRGIWAQPFVHPDAEAVTDNLLCLLQDLPYRSGRPVYVCVRSYQAWLESEIRSIGAQPAPRQAVMVRHLAITQRVAQTLTLAVNGNTEPTVPVARYKS